MLESAVGMFGRGRVTSTVIYGMGESDGDLTAIMERLCSMGVIPGMRALRVNKYNRESLIKAIGEPVPVDPGYVVEIARRQKEMMARYGLDTNTCHTMCLECGCCDIVPFRDL
jgi:biotin synthase-related radical SAM superfamily protein